MFFSDILLLLYKNATDFYMLMLYPEALLHLLITPTFFLVKSVGFSLCKIISSTNIHNFTSFFPIWMPLIFSSCLIALARTSSTSNMLNKSREWSTLYGYGECSIRTWEERVFCCCWIECSLYTCLVHLI